MNTIVTTETETSTHWIQRYLKGKVQTSKQRGYMLVNTYIKHLYDRWKTELMSRAVQSPVWICFLIGHRLYAICACATGCPAIHGSIRSNSAHTKGKALPPERLEPVWSVKRNDGEGLIGDLKTATGAENKLISDNKNSWSTIFNLGAKKGESEEWCAALNVEVDDFKELEESWAEKCHQASYFTIYILWYHQIKAVSLESAEIFVQYYSVVKTEVGLDN